ncbi:MAG: elongation factor P [Candidatus Peribacteraceae bacterium]|nr:elongation factor P [Candidatus Peribacteraceae bacterium]
MYEITDLKIGTNVSLDGEPYRVVWNQFSKTGRQGGVMAVKLKNLRDGKVIPKTFQGADKIQPAEIAMKKAQFLYKDDSGFNFMDSENFEQFPLSEEAVGEAGQFMQDGEEYDLMYFDGTPINVNLPIKMEFIVKETMPGVKGDTASGGTKPATLDCGITVQVPLFINEGEKIRINTETLEYVERA